MIKELHADRTLEQIARGACHGGRKRRALHVVQLHAHRLTHTRERDRSDMPLRSGSIMLNVYAALPFYCYAHEYALLNIDTLSTVPEDPRDRLAEL